MSQTQEAHFELRMPDGSIKLRKDGSVMEFKPSAYMIIENYEGDGVIMVRDCRTPAKLQFPGGGINIGRETPRRAAHREIFEEIGVKVWGIKELGMFETYEPVHLFLGDSWDYFDSDLRRKPFKPQLGEVSEVIAVGFDEINDLYIRKLLSYELYNAQYKMLGWYMLYRIRPDSFPVQKLWKSNPWKIYDRLTR